MEEIYEKDKIQEDEIVEIELTDKEKKKILLWKRIGASIHITFVVGLIIGLYLHYEGNWVYTIATYVVGYYLFLLLLSLIPKLGEVFYPGYRQIWDGHDFVWIEDHDYSKRYGFFGLIKNFIFYALVIVLALSVFASILPQYLLVIAFFAGGAIVLLQTLIFPLLKDLSAIISYKRILRISEKIETITYRTIILFVVALVVLLNFVYPLYTKPKMDVVKALNYKTPYYTQDLLKTAEVTYDYSYAGTECQVTYVGKINMNNMLLDVKTKTKLNFDAIDAAWESKETPHYTLLSEITVLKDNPTVYTDVKNIEIDGFEGEGIVTVRLTEVENGVGNGILEIYTQDEKLLHHSEFTIEKAPLLNVDAAYRATLKTPLDIGYFSNASMDIKIDISKRTFTFYNWTFSL